MIKQERVFRLDAAEVIMNIKKNSRVRWTFILGYTGVLLFLLGCMTVLGGTANVQQGDLQLDNGIVRVQEEDGNWTPVAGTSTFELVGSLESMEPWTVAGRTLATNDSTQVTSDLQAGDLVRVQGAILEDDTWLAYSIQPAEQQTDPVVTLIGTVESVDPWIVNGITLNITDETIIEGEITTGMLVSVEILLLEDGTWEVINIVPLGDLAEASGCATVIATVESVDGNQIRFLGWPTTVLVVEESQADDNNDDQENNEVVVSPGQKVLAVVCVSDGQIVIVQITILVADVDEEDGSGDGEKVLVCHKPDKKGGHTLSISSSAVPAHLGHGDTMGSCP
jgi:hypothetical protein